MPRKKISTTAKPKKTTSRTTATKNEEALMEFEQFVANKPSNTRGKAWLAFTLIVLIVVLGATWLFASKVENLERDHKFKAIYLDNGQTYYAKVVKEDTLNVYLDEVYYIQFEKQAIPNEDEDVEPQIVDVPVLIKRGQEIHKPQGVMQINRSKVLAIEEIGQDSEIITEINRINE